MKMVSPYNLYTKAFSGKHFTSKQTELECFWKYFCSLWMELWFSLASLVTVPSRMACHCWRRIHCDTCVTYLSNGRDVNEQMGFYNSLIVKENCFMRQSICLLQGSKLHFGILFWSAYKLKCFGNILESCGNIRKNWRHWETWGNITSILNICTYKANYWLSEPLKCLYM